MAIESVSPRQAADLLEAGGGSVYLDVRSVPEYAQGHPRSAVNIPLYHADARTGQLTSNPDFLRVVQANFPPTSLLLVGCLSGGRSLTAAEILIQAGYRKVANVRCGFGGARDALGRVVDPGWAALGLPVDRETQPGVSYQTLLAQAGS